MEVTCELSEVDLCRLWVRVLSYPRREFRGGPYLPPHPVDLERIEQMRIRLEGLDG